MTREETAEWVGYYFGLQRAGNIKPSFVRGEVATVAINELRKMIDAEMAKVAAMLPPGTIDAWPRDRGWIAAHRVDGPHIGR